MITYKQIENQVSMIHEADDVTATLDVGGRHLRGNPGDVRYVMLVINDFVSQLRAAHDNLEEIKRDLQKLAEALK